MEPRILLVMVVMAFPGIFLLAPAEVALEITSLLRMPASRARGESLPLSDARCFSVA